MKKNMETASKSGSIAVNLKHLIAYSDAGYGVLPNRYGETVLTKDSLLVMAGGRVYRTYGEDRTCSNYTSCSHR